LGRTAPEPTEEGSTTKQPLRDTAGFIEVGSERVGRKDGTRGGERGKRVRRGRKGQGRLWLGR